MWQQQRVVRCRHFICGRCFQYLDRQRRMVGCLMNDDLERTREEVSLASSSYCPGIYLEGLSESTKISVRTAGVPDKLKVKSKR
jgi:hypothetical protein